MNLQLLKISFLVIFLLWLKLFCHSQGIPIDTGYHYIHQGGQPEWEEFKMYSPRKQYRLEFQAEANKTEYCLQVRQLDVKTGWKILLNDMFLGYLSMDENEKQVYYAIRAGWLRSGMNILTLAPQDSTDDILFGEIFLHKTPVLEVLNEGKLMVSILDGNTTPVPSRLTIVNKKRILQEAAGMSNDTLAIRPGIIYTATGFITVGLPAGAYRIYATRGFEYGVDSTDLEIHKGQTIDRSLQIYREVETTGLISSDTHLHTLTYSHHGDATVKERLITIAGEGIEMPVITEHNISIDIMSLADSMGLLDHFTPVRGTEMTTSYGHFNVFPLTGNEIPSYEVKNWKEVKRNIEQHSSIKAIILNHARDQHKNFRPIDSTHIIQRHSVQPADWPFLANAIELINSGSTQTEPLQLTYDWFELINKGYKIAGIGSSDTHDVSRFLVGQSRTYIRSKDSIAGRINTNEVINKLVAGRTMVSFGLLTELTVNDRYAAGDTTLMKVPMKATARVSGPSWARAEKLTFFLNGKAIKEVSIKTPSKKGIKCEVEVEIPPIQGTAFLVAIAEGPDDHLVYWPISRPYQPRSTSWKGNILGISGIVWIKENQE